jgi:site-specific recombinase
MTFCATNLLDAEKQLVKSMIHDLGLSMADKWSSSCTHLITNEMKISLKIVLAVAHGRFIVSTGFLKALLDQYPAQFIMPRESE